MRKLHSDFYSKKYIFTEEILLIEKDSDLYLWCTEVSKNARSYQDRYLT